MKKQPKLKKLYKRARRENEIAMLLYHRISGTDPTNPANVAHQTTIQRRDALIDAIMAHPENKRGRITVMSKIIGGLTA